MMRIREMMVALLLVGFCHAAEPVEYPTVTDGRVTLQLFAADPQIVTPVNLTIDAAGRLLVIESHTHFPPKDYSGPKADRIQILQDTDGNGKADKISTFFDGSVHTMDIQAHTDGWVYVATRKSIFRIRDTDGDSRADENQPLITLTTTDDYPHNALSGLAFDAESRLYFGMGENHGAPYELKGSDGSAITGEGEGGSIFLCDANGGRLQRVTRGVWNPFGTCVDRAGRVFTVDNDPHARPPCRLIHVVPGGDYGFQHKYGAYGVSPLVSWNGELPGTLGMVSGTGEAPCEVLAVPHHAAPLDVVDQLLVTSWGGHRIELYDLHHKGASFTASRRDVIVGGENFRPVGMAVAPDGWIYFSDWVDRSYELHGKGRVWRMRWDKPVGPTPPPKPSADELLASQLRHDAPRQALLDALSHGDPFIRQAAAFGLSRHDEIKTAPWDTHQNPRTRLGLLMSRRLAGDPALLPHALADPDTDIQLAALRWVADDHLTQYRDTLHALLDSPQPTERVLQIAIAALDSLTQNHIAQQRNPVALHEALSKIASDANRPDRLRSLALRALPSDHADLSPEKITPWLNAQSPHLSLEVLRVLAERKEPRCAETLASVAGDDSFPSALRAEAVVGLAGDAESHAGLLITLAAGSDQTLANESRRALRLANLTSEQSQRLAALTAPLPSPTDRPPLDDTDAWLKRLPAQGDPDAGRRIFFQPRLATCTRCHAYGNRGRRIGPDLSLLSKRGDKRTTLQSILQPSKEIAPQYYTWSIKTTAGRELLAFHAHEDNTTDSITYLTAAGESVSLRTRDIAERTALPVSIMPPGLVYQLTDREISDLLAFLTSDE